VWHVQAADKFFDKLPTLRCQEICVSLWAFAKIGRSSDKMFEAGMPAILRK
jgi:hypothetical protein